MKTIRLYHPHTHEDIAYTPPPEGTELTVNDADAAVLAAWGLTTPPPKLLDAPVASTDAQATERRVDATDTAHDDEPVVTDAQDHDA